MFSCLFNININAQGSGGDGTLQGGSPDYRCFISGMEYRTQCTDPAPNIEWLIYGDYLWSDSAQNELPVRLEHQFPYYTKVNGNLVKVGSIKYYLRIKTNLSYISPGIPYPNAPSEVYIDILRVWFCPANNDTTLYPSGKRAIKAIQENAFHWLSDYLEEFNDNQASPIGAYFSIYGFPKYDYSSCRIMFKIPCSGARIDDGGCYRWLPCSNSCCDIWYKIKRVQYHYDNNDYNKICYNHAEVTFQYILSNDTICIDPSLNIPSGCETMCDTGAYIPFNKDTITLYMFSINAPSDRKQGCDKCYLEYQNIYTKSMINGESIDLQNKNAILCIYNLIGERIFSTNAKYNSNFNYHSILSERGLYFIQWITEEGESISSKSIYIE